MTFIIDNIIWFALLAGIIIVTLVAYAVKILVAVKQQSNAKNAVIKERVDNINLSIKTICEATIQQQCSISEATIRIITLLQVHPTLAGQFDSGLTHMNAFYRDIEHHPILENRKSTPKNVLRKLDDEREDLEAQYESKILKELEWLKGQNRLC